MRTLRNCLSVVLGVAVAAAVLVEQGPEAGIVGSISSDRMREASAR